jgi:uncharacterized protein (TIGR02217 family)
METWPLTLRRYGRLTVTPQFFTVVKRYRGGAKQRDIRWLAPVFRFEVEYDPLLTPDLFDVLETFYMRHRGMGRLFLFQDWTRPHRTGALGLREELGEGNGAQTAFKIYGDRAASVAVYLDGVLQSQPGQVTVDLATGLITFVTAPPAGVAVTADVTDEWFQVAFAADEMEQRRVGRGAGWLTRVVMEQDSIGVAAA